MGSCHVEFMNVAFGVCFPFDILGEDVIAVNSHSMLAPDAWMKLEVC